MEDLVRIEVKKIGDGEIQSVNARDLWEFIESRQDFSDWLKNRVEKYGFLENQDYIVHKFMVNIGQGKQVVDKIEYIISLDMAKELAMVENNEKGRQVRKYFLEVEKRYKGDNIANLLPEEIHARKIKAISETVGIYTDLFNLDEKAKYLFAENQLHKSGLPVPHVPLLEIKSDNDYIYERTEIYKKYNTDPHKYFGRQIKALLDKYCLSNEYASKFHYEKNGHNGVYYKFNKSIFGLIERELLINEMDKIKY